MFLSVPLSQSFKLPCVLPIMFLMICTGFAGQAEVVHRDSCWRCNSVWAVSKLVTNYLPIPYV